MLRLWWNETSFNFFTPGVGVHAVKTGMFGHLLFIFGSVEDSQFRSLLAMVKAIVLLMTKKACLQILERSTGVSADGLSGDAAEPKQLKGPKD